MDEIKLNKWIENFNQELQNIQAEYNSFLLSGKLDDFYKLNIDDIGFNLSLTILNPGKLPNEIEERLAKALTDTMPEDSI